MVIVHPEYAYLILEVNDLKEHIAELIVTKDMLINYTENELQMDYMLKIGSLEYKLYIVGNDYKKNIRKLELINEKIEKKLKINLSSIDRKIKKEFKDKSDFEAELSQQLDLAIEMASTENYCNYDRLEEMNLDYFKLQKMYNPIFDLQISEEKDKFFQKIKKYYEKTNFRKIHKLAEDYDEGYVFQDEIENLKILKKRYDNIVNELEKELRKIYNRFPFNQKVILEDENLYRRRKESINKEIAEINVENKKIEKKIKNKLKNIEI